MGLSPYRDVFMVLSLASFGATIFISYYGSPVPKQDVGVLRTSGLLAGATDVRLGLGRLRSRPVER